MYNIYGICREYILNGWPEEGRLFFFDLLIYCSLSCHCFFVFGHKCYYSILNWTELSWDIRAFPLGQQIQDTILGPNPYPPPPPLSVGDIVDSGIGLTLYPLSRTMNLDIVSRREGRTDQPWKRMGGNFEFRIWIREYWMIYWGPGFHAVVCFGFFPTSYPSPFIKLSLCFSVCHRSSLLAGEGDGGGGGAKSYDGERALSSINHSILSDMNGPW